MKTTQEMIAVMQAFVDGKTIEANPVFADEWDTCFEPVWNWNDTDYRVKPEPKYVPFSFEDAEFLIGKIIRRRVKNLIISIYYCDDERASGISYKDLLENYTFLDGSPCGKLKQ